MTFWNPGFAQSNWANGISERLGTFEKNYLYPSVLRALNLTQSEEFNRLIEDISYIRVLRIDSTFIEKNKDLKPGSESKLKDEGFKYLGALQDNKGGTKTLYVKEEDSIIKEFLVFVKNQNSLLIVEVVGNINIKHLSDLAKIDYEGFNEFVGL